MVLALYIGTDYAKSLDALAQLKDKVYVISSVSGSGLWKGQTEPAGRFMVVVEEGKLEEVIAELKKKLDQESILVIDPDGDEGLPNTGFLLVIEATQSVVPIHILSKYVDGAFLADVGAVGIHILDSDMAKLEKVVEALKKDINRGFRHRIQVVKYDFM